MTGPPDESVRERVARELDHTLFLAAAAGSGKTSVLVSRVLALVDHGVELGQVVAITFTEKAAAELRGRITDALGAPSDDVVVAARRRAALDTIDAAAIGTIHGFAYRLLLEHPLELGLPPRIEVADELTSDVAADERWQRIRDELLDETRLAGEPALARALDLGLAGGICIEHLRLLAATFDENWDRIEAAFLATPPPVVPRVDGRSFADRLEAICPDRQYGGDGDRMVEHLEMLATHAVDLADASEADTLDTLAWLTIGANTKGNKQYWPDNDRLLACRAGLNAIEADRAALVATVRDACLRTLAAFVAARSLRHARERVAQGRLEFHDLLVLARDLLGDPRRGPAVRESLARRYRYVLVDEFQDTDPLQVELALLLTTPAGRERPDEGRLFVVGDPLQSIYRFRRADVSAFTNARRRIAAEEVRLSANFRTTAPVLTWINHVFATLIGSGDAGQPPFAALDATRPAPAAGPSVVVLDGERDAPAAEVRARECEAVAAVVTRAVAEGWSVGDRRATYGDIAILLPVRTSLAELEAALRAAGVPYRIDASVLVYASREVRDLLFTLRAIDDHTDQLAVVSALRSSLFGCSDVELAGWRRAGGRFELDAEPVNVPGAVADGLCYLRSLADERWHLSPSELLERLVDDRRVLEVALDQPHWRDTWRRVRFMIDQARAWADAGGSTLRAYVAWARRQQRENVRIGEGMLPETDHDAVRILTIHAAKGLEFPITVVSGLGSRPNRPGRYVNVQWHFPAEIGCGKQVQTSGYATGKLTDDVLDDQERRRLLYVACTRARDHLVVSLHRKAGNADTSAHQLAAASADAPGQLVLTTVEASPSPPPPPPGLIFDLDAWRDAHNRTMAAAVRPTARSATALAADLAVAADPGLRKGAVDLDLPAWQRGRYGTAIGRAVHAVLQRADFATGEGVAEAARAQAAAEDVVHHEATVAALVRSALAAPIVRAAAGLPHWRELYVGAPIDGRVLEGYIDLLVRTPSGLVVVDYKTDAGDLDERVHRYRPQAAAYALAVEAVLLEPVVRAVFVFCTTGMPIEREVSDLPVAMVEARGALSGRRSG